MFEKLKIKFLGLQPAAKISTRTLDRIIQRDFPELSYKIKSKLENIECGNINRKKNRFSAAILKLSNGDITLIDDLIQICNNDYRDIISKAEYPRISELGFIEIEETDSKKLKQFYLSDWIDYSSWISRQN